MVALPVFSCQFDPTSFCSRLLFGFSALQASENGTTIINMLLLFVFFELYFTGFCKLLGPQTNAPLLITQSSCFRILKTRIADDCGIEFCLLSCCLFIFMQRNMKTTEHFILLSRQQAKLTQNPAE